MAPTDRSHPTLTAKTVLNGIAIAIIALPIIAALALVGVLLFGFLTLFVYVACSAFGAANWFAWTVALGLDLFLFALMWVNRK